MKKAKSRVEYSSNNSGGRWWLKDKDWKALEKAGWEVDWYSLPHHKFTDGGRWLGALASNAKRIGLSFEEAIAEFERVTKARASDAGCPCCGTPHNFTEYNGDKYVRSGPNTHYSASF